MRAIELGARDAAERPGLVLCHNVFDPEQPKKVLLRKGHVIGAAESELLRRLDGAPLHLIEIGPGDVGEDEAGERLGRAVAGPNIELAGISESQARLVSTERGLLRVDTIALERVNSHDGVTVWTLEDRMPVETGQHVASAKVAPLAVPGDLLRAAEEAAGAGAVRVQAFRNRKVAVLVRERMDERARSRFEASIATKIEWFGARPPVVRYVETRAESVADALTRLREEGAELVLVGGTGSTDPLDPTFRAIESCGGSLLRTGVPAHPGSTYWLAGMGETAVLGLASCGMFSQMTALDLLLPRFFAGEPIDGRTLTSLAVGGLIGRDRAYLFPRYGDSSGEREGTKVS